MAVPFGVLQDAQVAAASVGDMPLRPEQYINNQEANRIEGEVSEVECSPGDVDTRPWSASGHVPSASLAMRSTPRIPQKAPPLRPFPPAEDTNVLQLASEEAARGNHYGGKMAAEANVPVEKTVQTMQLASVLLDFSPKSDKEREYQQFAGKEALKLGDGGGSKKKCGTIARK